MLSSDSAVSSAVCGHRRSNLKGLYRGDIYNVYNCQRNIRASRPALVCWMGYSSFTAAHICIGACVCVCVQVAAL